jgi:hypothetical protein
MCGYELEDLVGGPQARRHPIPLEASDNLIIPLPVGCANPFVTDELGERRGEPLRPAVRPQQLADQWLAEKEIDEVYLSYLENPVE